jgi:hypothetical protein
MIAFGHDAVVKAGLLLLGISCVVFFVAKSKYDRRKADSG